MSQQWTDLQRYVIEEHFEEFTEGRISRRELVRRSRVGDAEARLTAAERALLRRRHPRRRRTR